MPFHQEEPKKGSVAPPLLYDREKTYMAKRRHGAPGRYAIIAAALLCIALGALTACGRKEEPTETQLGIDGYVYVPRLIYTSADEPASAGETDGNTFNKVHSLKV